MSTHQITITKNIKLIHGNPYKYHEKIERLSGGSQGSIVKCKRLRDGKLIVIKEQKVIDPNKKNKTKKDEYNSLECAERLVEALNKLLRTNSKLNILINFPHEIYAENWTMYGIQDLADYDLNQLFKILGGILSWEDGYGSAYKMFKQIIKAVNYCHENNILHRDLKPHNILVNKNTFDIKLTDFGICINTDPYKEREQTKFGSMLHLLPQQQISILCGEKYIGTGVDIDLYALLTIILRCLIGNDEYLHIFEEYLNKGDGISAVKSYIKLQNVMKHIENKIQSNNELQFFIKIFSYIKHNINHFDIFMDQIVKEIPKLNGLNKKNVPIYKNNQMYQLINSINKQIKFSDNIKTTRIQLIEEYFMSKLKYVRQSAKHLFENLKTKWVQNKTFNTAWYQTEQQKACLKKYLNPKYINKMQLSTHYDEIYNNMEELIGGCKDLKLNTNRTYGPSRGIVDSSCKRYNPFKFYICSKCGQMGKHFTSDCVDAI